MILNIQNLSIAFAQNEGFLEAVRNFSLTMETGEIIGLIGESGSGKTTVAQGVLGLTHSHPGIVEGDIYFSNQKILPKLDDYVKTETSQQFGISYSTIHKKKTAFYKAHQKVLSNIRGKGITAVFQEPKSALDPYFTIGEHLLEALKKRDDVAMENLKTIGYELLKEVGMPDPERVWALYPHEISGGMAQRIMIAMALAPKPKILIADEPTTALDVTTQAKILELLQKFQQKYGLSILLISHDMGVISQITNRVYVMHRGDLVETGPTQQVMNAPSHPYTAMLLSSFENFGKSHLLPPKKPSLLQGCAYSNLCTAYQNNLVNSEQQDTCKKIKPALKKLSIDKVDLKGNEHCTMCHFPETDKKESGLIEAMKEILR